MRVRAGQADLAFNVSGTGADGSADGRGGRTDVVLLHAGVCYRRGWGGLVDALTKAGHRVVAFDRRGFGETIYVPEPHSSVDDTLAVLEAAEMDRVAAIGNSMGGRVALDLALAHPERVEALVLIGTAVRGAPDPAESSAAVDRLVAGIDAAEEAGDLDEVNRLEAHLWLDGPAGPEGRVGGEARELFLEMNGRGLAAWDPGPEEPLPPAWDRLAEVEVPALVAVGELDLPHIQARSAAVSARLPRGRLLVLRGVAHLPTLEGSEVLASEVCRFLAPP
jgi:pimeloyl-ACP methyl ester carboxylesterase